MHSVKEKQNGAEARDDEEVAEVPQLKRWRLQERKFDAVEEIPCLQTSGSEEDA